MSNTFIIILALVLLVAMRQDLGTHRISNRLTLGGTVLALMLAAAFGSWSNLKDHFLGAAIAGGIWFIFWRLGMMGGGDQKLMMAVGALVGRDLALSVVFGVAIAGGLQALLTITIATPSEAREKRSLSFRDRLHTTRIPYSIAIAVGTIAVLLLDHFARLPPLI